MPPTVAATPGPLTGTTATAVSGTLTGLSPGTTYYYRAVAASANGTVPDSRTPPKSFQTLTPPSVTIGTATSVSATGATVQATINPNGSTTTARFQYSTDPSFPLTVTTALGSGFRSPSGVAVDGAGDVFVADTGTSAVKEVRPDGTIKTIGSGFGLPFGVAVDAAGDVFVADTGNSAVKEVLPDGSIKTIGSGFKQPAGVAVDGAGDVFVADSFNNRVVELSPPTVAARPAPLSGKTATAVTGTLTGLSPGTTYYYRAVASSPAGLVADLKNPPRSFQTLPAQPRTAPSTAAGNATAAAPATGSPSTSADLQRLIRDEVFLAVDMALAAQGGLPPTVEAAAIDVLLGDILANPLSHTPAGFLLGLEAYDALATAPV
jgi:hypothetical protein